MGSIRVEKKVMRFVYMNAGIVRDANLIPTTNGKEFWDLVQCYSLNVNYDNYGGSVKENSNSETFRFFSKESAEKAHQNLRKAISMVE